MSITEHDIPNPAHVHVVQKNGKLIVNIMTDDGITIEYGVPIAKKHESQEDLDFTALKNLLKPI